MKRILFLGALLAPVLAYAQTYAEPTDLSGAAAFLPAIIAAVKSGSWLFAGSGIALVVTFAIKKYLLPKIGAGNGWLPIVSALVGMLGGVGLAVVNGASLHAASLAVLSGPLASTLWESVVQYFFKKPVQP